MGWRMSGGRRPQGTPETRAACLHSAGEAERKDDFLKADVAK
jgi:hypothetical protein